MGARFHTLAAAACFRGGEPWWPTHDPGMDWPTGIHATIELEDQDGLASPMELAVGPTESLGDLEDVIERFTEAFCISANFAAFTVIRTRLCLLEPESMRVCFDADDEGRPDLSDAMSARFSFAFMSQIHDEPSLLDPWLVVRPCTKDQVAMWYELMAMTGGVEVHTWCLDARLTSRFTEVEEEAE